jgi:hypothetical protein
MAPRQVTILVRDISSELQLRSGTAIVEVHRRNFHFASKSVPKDDHPLDHDRARPTRFDHDLALLGVTRQVSGYANKRHQQILGRCSNTNCRSVTFLMHRASWATNISYFLNVRFCHRGRRQANDTI